MTAQTGLVRYDEMVRAIDLAYEVDEVKEIRDKARVMEVYAQIAQNFEAERRACEIRLRSERKAGKLLATRDKTNGARGFGSNQYQKVGSGDTTPPKTLSELGISKDQSASWQALAEVPEEDFEAALTGPERPTTRGILRQTAEEKPARYRIEDDVLWLWGTLRDFERHRILNVPFADIFDRSPEHVRKDFERLVPLVRAWLEGGP